MEYQNNQRDNTNPTTSIIAGLAFFFIFIQLNLIAPLNSTLSTTYHLSPTEIGFFSASYLIGIATFYMPAGFLIDFYGPQKQLVLGLGMNILCLFILGNSHSLSFLLVGRFIAGLFHALVFISCIRITSNHYRHHKAAYIGLTITIGLLGGVITQYPFIHLMAYTGWRAAVNIIGYAGIAILCLEILFFNKQLRTPLRTTHQNRSLLNFPNLKKALKNPLNFLFGFYACMMDLPSITIGASWGNRYVSHIYHLSANATSTVIPWLFIGLMIGSPLSGWLSDYLKKRKPIMILAAVILCGLTLLWGGIALSYSALVILTFLIGVFSGFQVLIYTCLAEVNHHNIESLATSYASIIIMGGNAVLMPVVGWIISRYPTHLYYSLLIIPLLLFVNIVLMSLFAKESHTPKQCENNNV